MEMPEFLNYLWQCEDVNGLQGFGINRGLLICPLYSHRISNGQFGIKKLPFRAVFSDVLQDERYFFLCIAQKADFPTDAFLHFVPCFVLPAHIAFFAVAMSTLFC